MIFAFKVYLIPNTSLRYSGSATIIAQSHAFIDLSNSCLRSVYTCQVRPLKALILSHTLNLLPYMTNSIAIPLKMST